VAQMIILFKICMIISCLAQSIYWLGLFLRVKPRKSTQANNKKVSLVICVKNDWDKLSTNLDKLLLQNGLIELIMIDDNSNPSNSVIYASYLINEKIQIYPNNGVGKKQALETAMTKVKGDWILLTDADCIPNSNMWLTKMSDFDSQYKIVLGFAPFWKTTGLFNSLIRYESVMNSLCSFAAIEINLTYNGVGRNMLYHKSLFDIRLMKADIPYGDDDLLINSQAKYNHTIYSLDKQTFVYSKAKENYKDYFLQKWRHYATSLHYRTESKLFLGVYFLSLFFLYFSFGFLFMSHQFLYALVPIFIYIIIKMSVLKFKLNHFNEEDLFLKSIYLEPLYLLHLILQSPLLLFPKKTW